jgi:phosphatidylglycerophosphate synthase
MLGYRRPSGSRCMAAEMDNNAGSSDFHAEINSTFEPVLLEKVCEPVLQRIPRSVHPNTISLLNHLTCWITGTLAYLSLHLAPPYRTLALVGAGLFMFFQGVGDCLDGMQARRTDQCSKLGEVLDHWLDAIHVPMVTFGLALAMDLSPWATVAVHVTNTMIYNAQLVLYHKTGRFVHTDTSGTDAVMGVSIIYVVLGVLFYFFDPSSYWTRVGITVAAVVATATQLKLNVFYYVRLKGLVLHHLPFVLLSAGFSALHLLGIIDRMTFLLSIVLLSFRITGSYVLFTVLGRRFSGFDLGVALLIVATLAAHYLIAPIPLAGRTVQFFLPLLACLYMVGRNLIDFARSYPELRPAPKRD